MLDSTGEWFHTLLSYAFTVVLSGTPANMDFRGFLIQARTMADGSPVGQFMTDGSNDQQSRCTGNVSI